MAASAEAGKWDQLVSPGFYWWTIKSRFLVEVLSDDLPQRRSTHGKGIKILPSKQILRILPILLT